MKKCLNCSFDNADDAKFCVKCGSMFKEEQKQAVPDVGTKTDATQNTAPLPLEAPAELSTAQPTPTTAPSATKTPKSSAKSHGNSANTLRRILNLLRAGLTTVFALVMFIMSFFSVQQISLSGAAETINYDDVELIVVEVSSIDLIEGAFAVSDPDSAVTVASDFMAFVLKHTSDRERQILDNVDHYPLQSAAILIRVIEEYNPLKLMAVSELVEDLPNLISEIWISAIFSLFYIILCGIFLIFSIVDLIATILKKENRIPGLFKTNILTVAAAIGFAGILKLIFGYHSGFGLNAVICFGLVTILLEIGYRIYNGELHFEKSKLPKYISVGVSAVLTLVMITFVSSSLLRVSCEYFASAGQVGQDFKAGYNASALAEAWNALKEFGKNESMLGSAQEYIPNIFRKYGSLSILSRGLMEAALSPAMMGILGNMEVEVLLAVFGVLIEVVCIGFIVTLALTLTDHFKAIADDRNSKLVYGILNASFALVLLTLSIVYMILVNKTIKELSGLTYKAGLSAFLIVAVILSFVDLAQKIVNKIITKKKQTTPAPSSGIQGQNIA